MTLGEIKIILLLEIKKLLQGTSQSQAELKKIATSSKQASDSLKQIGTSGTSGLKNLLTTLGLTSVSIAGAVMLIKRMGQAGIDEFLSTDKAAKQLLFTLNGNSDAFNRLNGFAQEWESKTIFDADDINAASAFLVMQGRTEEQIKKTITAASHLQTIMGGDLMTNVRNLDGTFEGMTGRLGKLDSRINNLTKTQLANGKAIDILLEKYDGFAEKMTTTYAGKWEQFKIKFRNTLGDMVGDIVKFIDKLPDFGIEIQRLFANIAYSLADLARNMKNFWNSLPFLGKIIGGPMGDLSGWMEGEMTETGDMFQKIVKKHELEQSVMGTIKKVKDKIDQMKREKLKGGKDGDLGTSGTAKTEDKKDPFAEMMKDIENMQALWKLTNKEEGKSLEQLVEILKTGKELADNDEKRVQWWVKLRELQREISDASALKLEGFEPKSVTDELVGSMTIRRLRNTTNVNPRSSEMSTEQMTEIGNTMTDAMSTSGNYALRIMEYFGQSESAVAHIVSSFLSLLELIKGAQQVGNIFSFLIGLFPGGSVVGGLGGGGAAEGGLIRGPGTSTSDSIPMRLSDFEYVIKASRVKQLGVGFLNWLNNGSGSGDMYKAGGGLVRSSMGVNGNAIYLNGKILDDAAKREIASRGIYLENLSVEKGSY